MENDIKPKIKFVDSHFHLWDLEANKYGWLEGDGVTSTTEWIGNYSAIRCSYLLKDFLNEAKPCGLIKSVHIEAGWSGSNTVGETAWLQSLAEIYNFPHGIVANVDLRASDVEEQLSLHSMYPNLRGIRMLPMNGLVENDKFLHGFKLLEKLNLNYDLNTRVPNMDEARDLARRFPNTYLIVNNTANPMERTREYFQQWRKGMSRLAELPNVLVKISGLGMSDHSWSVESIRSWVLTSIDLFGTHRSMFASNWPVDKLYSSYEQLIDAYMNIIDSFSETEKQNMFSNNAEQYYRI